MPYGLISSNSPQVTDRQEVKPIKAPGLAA